VVVSFDWPAVVGAAGYMLQIDAESPPDWSNLWCDEYVSESHLEKEIPGGQMSWRVKAVGEGACPDGPWKGPYQYTDVQEIESMQSPSCYTLAQNYPNPFNPYTRIEFSLPRRSFVTIDVFNILGARVKRLVNETLSAGQMAVIWDGRNERGSMAATGVYLYRITTEDFVQTKKMILVK
jgi:hypothetical protein